MGGAGAKKEAPAKKVTFAAEPPSHKAASAPGAPTGSWFSRHGHWLALALYCAGLALVAWRALRPATTVASLATPLDATVRWECNGQGGCAPKVNASDGFASYAACMASPVCTGSRCFTCEERFGARTGKIVASAQEPGMACRSYAQVEASGECEQVQYFNEDTCEPTSTPTKYKNDPKAGDMGGLAACQAANAVCSDKTPCQSPCQTCVAGQCRDKCNPDGVANPCSHCVSTPGSTETKCVSNAGLSCTTPADGIYRTCACETGVPGNGTGCQEQAITCPQGQQLNPRPGRMVCVGSGRPCTTDGDCSGEGGYCVPCSSSLAPCACLQCEGF